LLALKLMVGVASESERAWERPARFEWLDEATGAMVEKCSEVVYSSDRLRGYILLVQRAQKGSRRDGSVWTYVLLGHGGLVDPEAVITRLLS
jgi:hypothetical protein